MQQSNSTPSGMEGLDQILYGGLPRGSAIIVEGAPGTGKTTLGTQFLYYGAVQFDEPGIYITFEEFPQQIYQDMKAFDWDLRTLEKQNKLRVISIKPDTLLQEMKRPNGLFEQLVQEIQCQRIVIDSVSLFRYLSHSPDENRDTLYMLRNILRKHSLTALLLSERNHVQDEQIPFEHYVADGVIRLSLTEQMTKYRKRTLEILKMRGSKIIEGEHIYRITENGIHLIPALSMVEDIVIVDNEQLSTGIKKLDRMLSGGIPRESVFILDTNSKANYRFLIGSILSQRIKDGDNIIALLSSLMTISDMQEVLSLYEVDLEQLSQNKDIFFIEHYNRPIPDGFEDVVLDVQGMSNEQYRAFVGKNISPSVQESIEKGEHWFVYYDLNTIFSERGAEFVKRFFAEEAARMRAAGFTVLALCNFTEIGVETASFLERTTNGVIRTWVDGNYQYLQLAKAPNGKVSEPHIVENIAGKPFIDLI